MTGQGFRESALDNRSEEELANLNAWLRENLNVDDTEDVDTRQQARREVEEEVRHEQKGERSKIATTNPGHFTG